MIIKNNFNKNSADPPSNYESIRKTRDDNVNNENRKKARRLEKKVMNAVIKNEELLDEYEDDEWNDWHF